MRRFARDLGWMAHRANRLENLLLMCLPLCKRVTGWRSQHDRTHNVTSVFVRRRISRLLGCSVEHMRIQSAHVCGSIRVDFSRTLRSFADFCSCQFCSCFGGHPSCGAEMTTMTPCACVVTLLTALGLCRAVPLSGPMLTPREDGVAALNEPCYVHDAACEGYPVCCVTAGTCITQHSGTISSNTAAWHE